MTVVLTGPEGSGTRWLWDLVSRMIPDPIHRTMPTWDLARSPRPIFWSARPEERYVIIQRRPDVTQLSLLGQAAILSGEIVGPLRTDWRDARDLWERAIIALAAIPDAYWISYEALVADPRVQLATLARWLGTEPPESFPEPVDGNAKWLSWIERI